MTDLSLDEKIDSEKQELTLELVNAKVEKLFELMEKMYDSIVKSVDEKLLRDTEYRNEMSEHIAQGFNSLSIAIAGLNCGVEVVLETLEKKLEVKKEDSIKEIATRAQAALQKQFELLKKQREAVEAQAKAEAEVVPPTYDPTLS